MTCLVNSGEFFLVLFSSKKSNKVQRSDAGSDFCRETMNQVERNS